jgi:hypothetical protein
MTPCSQRHVTIGLRRPSPDTRTFVPCHEVAHLATPDRANLGVPDHISAFNMEVRVACVVRLYVRPQGSGPFQPD